MPFNYEVSDPKIIELLRRLATKLKEQMPKGWGFSLFLFTFGSGGSMYYISSAQREDMIAMVKEWLAKQEAVN